MNKLENLLRQNSDQIRETRAKFIADDMKDQQEELVRQLRRDLSGLNRKLTDLTDFYPDSALSLKVVKDSFKAAEWVQDLQNCKMEIRNTEIQLKIAEKTYNEYFKEEENEDISK